jgi:hypothetical protein
VANINDLTYRVRLELGDQPQQFTFNAVGDGHTSDYAMPCKPIDINTLAVYVNGTPIAYPTGYTAEFDLGVIHFVHTPAAGATILVTGNKFRYFTDDDICTFINTAITQHTYNRTDAFGSNVTIQSLEPVEEYPLAILAVIEALWVLATDAAFDINITAPDGVVIPRAQRYQQLTSMIENRWNQYKTLCAQLNIGLWRIEMGTLRRISRTTNKLIPVYMPQEVDDARRPERVYLQNDLTGRKTLPSYVKTQDLILYQGDSYSEEVDFPFDITGLEFKAQIRTYPNAPSLYATFKIDVVSTSESLSKINLSLTKQDTAYMPVRAFWDLQATDPMDSTYEATYLKGQVFTTQETTLD